MAVLAGLCYGGLFQRAAADRRGGWLFGISYGFLLWMLGPITLLQMLFGRPLATGTAAMGILAANLLSGLILGLLFRPAHRVVRRSLERHSLARAQDVAPRAAEQSYGR
jgi:peptidoglycan/LPS O-acetylase OafA/YrhL